MNRRQLANGKIMVWMDGNATIIHHANGLTLALTEEEARELLQWLGEQDATSVERAEFLNWQQMERETNTHNS